MSEWRDRCADCMGLFNRLAAESEADKAEIAAEAPRIGETQMQHGFIVARLKGGQPFDWLHEESLNGHTITLDRSQAKRFPKEREAVAAANRAMKAFPLATYRAEKV